MLRFTGATVSGLMLGEVFCNKERIKNVKAVAPRLRVVTVAKAV